MKTGSFIKHQTEISQTAEFTKAFKRDFRYIKVVEDIIKRCEGWRT